MDADEIRALDDIDKYGCHILHVLEDNGHPRFTYSIGIQSRSNQPELIVTGLKKELAILDFTPRLRQFLESLS
jgi:hypothetical protein